jgi:hypothetical protein
MPGGPSRPSLRFEKLEERRLSGEALLVLAQAALQRGVGFRFSARGSSMTPFMRDEDVITLTPLGSRPPRLGEVVGFAHPGSGKLIVHRVVGLVSRPRACDRGAVLIGGDWVETGSDGLIPLENVLGRVTGVERAGKSIRFGLGPERILIAALSRLRLLMPLGGLVRVCRDSLCRIAPRR